MNDLLSQRPPQAPAIHQMSFADSSTKLSGGLSIPNAFIQPHHQNDKERGLPAVTNGSATLPLTLSLKEDASKPGQYQLMLNVNPESGATSTSDDLQKPLKLADGRPVPGLGYDVSHIYRKSDSSPPISPLKEDQGWSDLSSVPPELFQSVAPDWNESLPKSDALQSNPSTKLNHFKARIRRSGRGIIVRLRKGGVTESEPLKDSVKEIHLTERKDGSSPQCYELDTPDNAVELDSTPIISEMDSSNPPTTPRTLSNRAHMDNTSASLLLQSLHDARVMPSRSLAWSAADVARSTTRQSISTDGEFSSDAETLYNDRPPTGDIWDVLAPQSSAASYRTTTDGSTTTTRRNSLSSILETPVSLLPTAVQWPSQSRSSPRVDRRRNSWESLEEAGANDHVLESPVRKRNLPITNRIHKKRNGKSPIKPRRTAASASIEERHIPADSGKPAVAPAVPTLSFDHEYLGEIMPDFSSPGQLTSRSKSVTATSTPLLLEHQRRTKSFNTQPSVQTRQRKSFRRRHTTAAASLQSNAKPSKLKLLTKDIQNKAQKDASPSEPQTLSPSIPSPRSSKDSKSPIRGILRETPSQTSIETRVHMAEDPVVRNLSPEPESQPATHGIPLPHDYDTRYVEAPRRSTAATYAGLAVSGLLSAASRGINWLQKELGPEQPVKDGHVRVRWTCHCGEALYDDFVERRAGAARELEAYLNRPQSRGPRTRTHAGTYGGSTHSSSSSMASSIFSQPGVSPSSTFGSQSSFSFDPRQSPKATRGLNPFSVVMGSHAQQSWLLTCANEGRFTTKLVHLDMCRARIRSDKDMALALREHYHNVNQKWFRWLKLRGLNSIQFVQFEVHRNRFTDIRKSPDMPSGPRSKEFYDFEPHDLVPPVGEKYLLHLFKHPEDYDGELICYLRSPKAKERLDIGVGWGIHLVDGFLPARVWSLVFGVFALGSLIFAIAWICVKDHDVQGAFGVAAWMTTLAGLSVAWAQACLD